MEIIIDMRVALALYKTDPNDCFLTHSFCPSLYAKIGSTVVNLMHIEELNKIKQTITHVKVTTILNRLCSLENPENIAECTHEIALNPDFASRMVKFFQMQSMKDANCVDFAETVAGLNWGTGTCKKTGFRMRPKGMDIDALTEDITFDYSFKQGDVVTVFSRKSFSDPFRFVHCAVYLGNGIFLSKNNHQGGFVASCLNSLVSWFGSQYTTNQVRLKLVSCT